MKRKTYTAHALASACILALTGTTNALADDTLADDRQREDTERTTYGSDADEMREHKREAKELLADARRTLKQMKQDPQLRQTLQQSSGVFVIPDYGRGALIVGARGGEGVLMTGTGDRFDTPVFYDYGGISAGLQAGAEAGGVAMILRTDEALDSFMQEDNWSLNADAGLTVVNWSARAQGSVGKGDVVVWSDTEGLLGDAALSVTDIHFDDEETAAFYGKSRVTLEDVRSDRLELPRDATGSDAPRGE